MSFTLLVSALVVGLLGGGHCVAMCGGLVSAVAARDVVAREVRLPSIAVNQFAYHVGRIGTYALLGAAFGLVGTGVRLAADLGAVQRAIYVAANLFLLLLAASLLVRVRPLLALERLGGAAAMPLVRRVQPMLRAPGLGGRIALGLAWGLMPCALVYSTLPLALLAGGAAQGALVMFAFGLGTLPNLLAGGVVLAHARRALSAMTLRYAGAAVLGAFGLLGLWRALAGPETGLPFCLVP